MKAAGVGVRRRVFAKAAQQRKDQKGARWGQEVIGREKLYWTILERDVDQMY